MTEVKLDIYPNYDLAISTSLYDGRLRNLYECVLGFAASAAVDNYAMAAVELRAAKALIKDYYQVDTITFAHTLRAVCLMGANKYGFRDYIENGISYSARINSALRHILREADGETVDDESGYPQLYHTFANLAMIYEVLLDAPENGRANSNDLNTNGGKNEE